MENEIRCEMCGTKMLPNMLNEYKTGNVVAVHVCPNCGLVTRDNDEEPVDMFHYDQYRVQDEWRNDGSDIGEQMGKLTKSTF